MTLPHKWLVASLKEVFQGVEQKLTYTSRLFLENQRVFLFGFLHTVDCIVNLMKNFLCTLKGFIP